MRNKLTSNQFEHIRKGLSSIILFVMMFCFGVFLYAMPGGGPSSPETSGFKDAGTTELVSPFTGDFSYSIPLMDIGGYPLNLAYSSNVSMDQDASWVGLGWTLNPGSVNRQMRGLPDDFNGDLVLKEIARKDNWTGSFTIGPAFKLAKIDGAKLNLKIGMSYNNFVGFNTILGGGLSLELMKGLNLSTNFTSSTENGVDVDANVSFDFTDKKEKGGTSSLSLSGGFGANSREGAKYLSFGASLKSESAKGGGNSMSLGSASYSFATPSFTPSIPNIYNSNSFNLRVSLGAKAFFANADLDMAGSFSYNYLKTNNFVNPAYGNMFLHNSQLGDGSALQDFNREKDVTYNNDKVNFIPIPVLTFDNFDVNQHGGGGSYRTKRNDIGILSDPKSTNETFHGGGGANFAVGNTLSGGGEIDFVSGSTTNSKWIEKNLVMTSLDFKGEKQAIAFNKFDFEPCSFINSGEMRFSQNANFLLNQPSSFRFNPIKIDVDDNGKANPYFLKEMGGIITVPNATDASLVRMDREVKNAPFTYLSIDESNNFGMQKTIPNYYPPGQINFLTYCGGIAYPTMDYNKYAKKHHIGQITVTNDDGSRNIYGLPVYNIVQADVSFSINANVNSCRPSKLVTYINKNSSIENKDGIEGHYSKEIVPAYSHSHLLTGFLSKDYQDLTGNGISEDDMGDAVKFNYFAPPQNVLKWRVPFDDHKANYQPNLLTDTEDDKASYTYGEKQLVYLHSIESKTTIAVLYSSPRTEDGFGVDDLHGKISTSVHQYKLDSIALFSKAEINAMNVAGITDLNKLSPIKKVVFEYDYSLCVGAPNSINPTTGKLTLKKIYFKFGNNDRKLAYNFEYNGLNPNYNNVNMDRWGNYKNQADNPNGLLNDEFPYTLQQNTVQDVLKIHQSASAWLLTDIKLPTGGQMKVEYEADDYAYVQDRQAMQLFKPLGFSAKNNGKPKAELYSFEGPPYNAVRCDYIHFDLPVACSTANEVIEKYLDGDKYHFFKANLNLKETINEYVTGYFKLDLSSVYVYDNYTKFSVKMIPQEGHNPISYAGWKFYKQQMPHKFFPGQVRNDEMDAVAVIESFFAHLDVIKELLMGVDENAKSKGYCFKLDIDKSWVRLKNPWNKKYGGGSRVKKISTIDNWETMVTGQKNSVYGQEYSYETDQGFSSGVASYEPILGGEENPFKLPNSIKENTATFFLEEPFGESFFPSPSVGYSKVKITPFGAYGIGSNYTTKKDIGGFEKQFYTAKDFPTKALTTVLTRKKDFSNIPAMLYSYDSKKFYLSQGYMVELNNMHGVPKADYTFNGAGAKISFQEFVYKTNDSNQLVNDVKVLDADGEIRERELGVDMEVFTEMKSSSSESVSTGLSLTVGFFLIPFIVPPIPVIFVLPNGGENYAEFRSASTMKLINRKGILQKTKAMSNGSIVTAENLVYDYQTAKPIVVSSSTEYDNQEYQVSYPAHFAYEGVSGAYKNLGLRYDAKISGGELTHIKVLSNYIAFGQSEMKKYFYPGDEFELINSVGRMRLWMMDFTGGGTTNYKFIDEKGRTFNPSTSTYTTGNLTLVRSGRRNILNANVGEVKTQSNPLDNSATFFKSNLNEVVEVSAKTMYDKWRTNSTSYLDIKFGTSIIQMLKLCDDFEAVGLPVDFSFYIIKALIDQDSRIMSGSYISLWDIVDKYHGPSSNNAVLNSSNPNWMAIQSALSSIPLVNDVSGTINSTLLKNYKAHFGTYSSEFSFPKCSFYHLDYSTGVIDHTNYLELPICSLANVSFNNIHSLITEEAQFCDKSSEQLKDFYVKGNRLYKISSFYYDRAALCNDNKDRFDIQTSFSTCFKDLFVNIKDQPGDVLCNPFLYNLKGDWRDQSSLAFNYSRKYGYKGPEYYKNGKMDDLKFWKFNSNNQLQFEKNDSIIPNIMVNYDSKGNLIETQNALGVYSASKYGYMKTLSTVVAENARYQNVFFEGYEDTKFNLSCNPNNANDLFSKNYSWSDFCGSNNAYITDEESHTGRYSFRVNEEKSGECDVKLSDGYPDGQAYYTLSSGNGVAMNKSNILSEFNPETGVNYLLSVWVKKNDLYCDVNNKYTHAKVTLLFNNAPAMDFPIETYGGKMVEDWQQINATFTMPPNVNSLAIKLTSDAGISYFDDLRIFPVNGNMKSFVYDPFNLRHVADLDENNFATFYDYDEAGNLIRVRKETERGVMTIKESRIYYKNNQ